MADQGQVISISMSATGGIPKYVQDSIAVGAQGVEGDQQAQKVRRP